MMRMPETTSTHGLRHRILAGEVLIGTFLNLGSPVVAEICGLAGFDWAVVDLEHGSGSEGELVGQLQALGGTPAAGLVRVESHERARIGKALDAGSAGVVVPRVDSADQARAVVAAMRYPPQGTRGVAAMNRAAGFGSRTTELIADQGESLVAVVQVESEAAIRAVGDVAAVEGVDVVFVGPADLSHGLGVFGDYDHPRFRDAVSEVAVAAAKHGKAAGTLVGSPEEAARYAELGYRFLGVGGDSGHLATGARSVAQALRALTTSMDDRSRRDEARWEEARH